MAGRSGRWRRRKAFSRAAAAGIQMRRAARFAGRSIRDFIDSSALWTTSVVAGFLALLLTFLLFVLVPSPSEAVPASPPSPDPAADVELSLHRGALEDRWDDRQAAAFASEPTFVADAFSPVAVDAWTAAQVRPTEPPPAFFDHAERADAAVGPSLAASEHPPESGEAAPELVLGITVEKQLSSDGVDAPLQYTLLVTNHTQQAIERLSVSERVPDVNRVIETVPAASVSQTGELVWDLTDLQPGDSRRLLVTAMPAGAGPWESTAAIEVSSRLSVVTRVGALPAAEPAAPEPSLADVEPPEASEPASHEDTLPRDAWTDLPEQVESDPRPEEPRPLQPVPRPRPLVESPPPAQPVLRVSVSTVEAVQTGDVVTATYDITNVGTAAADDVSLTVDLTDQLVHRHGRRVEHRIERLEPGETRRAQLRTVARTAGTATLETVAAHSGGTGDRRTDVIRVMPTP